jgi:hypothetical protein
MTEDELRETSPEVWVPTDEDHTAPEGYVGPKAVFTHYDEEKETYEITALAREALDARQAKFRDSVYLGVLAAHTVRREWAPDPWQVGGFVNGHKVLFIEYSLVDAFRLLGEAVEGTSTTKE